MKKMYKLDDFLNSVVGENLARLNIVLFEQNGRRILTNINEAVDNFGDRTFSKWDSIVGG